MERKKEGKWRRGQKKKLKLFNLIEETKVGRKEIRMENKRM